MPRRQTTKIGKLQSIHKSRTPVHHKNNGKQTMRAKSGKPKTMKTQMVGAGPKKWLNKLFGTQKPESNTQFEFFNPIFANPTKEPPKVPPKEPPKEPPNVTLTKNIIYEAQPNSKKGTESGTTTLLTSPSPKHAQLAPSDLVNEYAQPNPGKEKKKEEHLYAEPYNPNPNRNTEHQYETNPHPFEISHYAEAGLYGLSVEEKDKLKDDINELVDPLEFYNGFYVFITSHMIKDKNVECCSIYKSDNKQKPKLELLMSYLLGKCNDSIHKKIKGITEGVNKKQTLDDKKFFVYRNHNNLLILCTKPLCYMQNQSNSGFRLLFNDLVINDKKILYTHIPKKIPIKIYGKISFTELENPQFIIFNECDNDLIYDKGNHDTYMTVGPSAEEPAIMTANEHKIFKVKT